MGAQILRRRTVAEPVQESPDHHIPHRLCPIRIDATVVCHFAALRLVLLCQ